MGWYSGLPPLALDGGPMEGGTAPGNRPNGLGHQTMTVCGDGQFEPSRIELNSELLEVRFPPLPSPGPRMLDRGLSFSQRSSPTRNPA